MKFKKSQLKNLFFLAFIALLIIPQTRLPLQVLLHKGIALFSPSVEGEEDRVQLTDYNWQLEDELGNRFNFSDAKGKVIVLNFWATWCPPCIAEMPSFQKLHDNYKEDVVFLFVSNEDKEKVQTFISKNDYTFKFYKPLTQYPKVFNVSSIPRTFVIDKQGYIVIDKTGAANWNSETVNTKIKALLFQP